MRASILSLLLWVGPPLDPELVPAPERASATSEDDQPDLQAKIEPTRPHALSDTAAPNLHVHWEVDLPLTISASAIWLGSELLREQLVPASPRWTKVSAADLATREALTWRSPARARQASNVFAAGVVPLFGLTLTLVDIGTTRQWRTLPEDLLVVAEAVAVAGLLTQAIKLASARGRPYTHEVYQSQSAEPLEHLLVYEPDAHLSFPSAHVSVTFAFASSLATVATLRQRKLAPYLWGLGMPLAGFVGYLRVAAHRHWFSDVVIGSTLGSLVGAGLPILLHHPDYGLLARLSTRKRALELQVVPSASGATVLGRF